MDPNKTLDNIRALITELHRTNTTGHIIELANELAWTVTDLDTWLSNGGFPPTAWTSHHNTKTER